MKYVYLVIIAITLISCEGLQADPQRSPVLAEDEIEIAWQPSQAPIGADTVTDVQGAWRLYGGQELHQGYAYPDGRVWLYDANSEKHYQLTQEAHFGQHFFASGGVFIDQHLVLVKVNSSLEQETLYLINLADGSIRHWLSAADLGLVEIIEDTWLLTPDKRQLGFSAFREVDLANENFVWQLGVYSLDSETKALATIALEPLDQEPGYLVPGLEAGSVIAVAR